MKMISSVLIIAFAFFGCQSASKKAIIPPPPHPLANPFKTPGHWYKANLHTHTTLSDGDVGPEVRVEQYRQAGYQVLLLSDHEVPNQVQGFSSENFLVIGGMETHPEFIFNGRKLTPYHFVCVNIPENYRFPADMPAQARIDFVNRQGGAVIFAHPYWSGHDVRHLLTVKDYAALEVFNGDEVRYPKNYNSVAWDQLSNEGRILGAIAADDLHHSQKLGRSWTMIKAPALTTEAIVQALRDGSFYASCGPTIEDFRIENGVAKVRCSPVLKINFMGSRMYGSGTYGEPGKPITSAEYQLPQGIAYVRVEVEDEQGRHSWTNPIVVSPSADK